LKLKFKNSEEAELFAKKLRECEFFINLGAKLPIPQPFVITADEVTTKDLHMVPIITYLMKQEPDRFPATLREALATEIAPTVPKEYISVVNQDHRIGLNEVIGLDLPDGTYSHFQRTTSDSQTDSYELITGLIRSVRLFDIYSHPSRKRSIPEPVTAPTSAAPLQEEKGLERSSRMK
jgi:hypothetical protein